MTREEKAIMYFKDMRKKFCEDYLLGIPKDSVAYKATMAEKEFYDTAIEALEQQPCTDAVSRQALLKLMGEEPFNWTDSDQELQEVEDYRNFRNMVEQLPPIRPQEPKTGHWRHYEGMLICSECGAEFYDDIMEYCGDDVPKCCPDCGIRMVEPQERSEE